MAWLGHPESLLQGGTRQPLLSALRSVDASFDLNHRRPYQAINRKGYEVELLAAPSGLTSLHALATVHQRRTCLSAEARCRPFASQGHTHQVGKKVAGFVALQYYCLT